MNYFAVANRGFYPPHSSNNPHTSHTICPYCHDLHTERDMKDGICSKMREYALQQRKKYAYECCKCQGEGCYEEALQSKILQSNKKFEERWQKWSQNNQENTQSQKPPPVRRVIRTNIKSEQRMCDQCNGQGQIYRTVTIKDKQSQPNMQNSKFTLNPLWLKYRMKPIIVQNQFDCSMCHTQVAIFEKSFKLSCNHQFHYGCIFLALKQKSQCPTCKSIDPFVDVQYFEQYQEQAQECVEGDHNRTIKIAQTNALNVMDEDQEPEQLGLDYSALVAQMELQQSLNNPINQQQIQ